MTANYTTAVNEIQTLLKAAWDTTGFPLKYQNVKGAADPPPSTTTPWARSTIQHTPGGQVSLSGGVGGAKRWQKNGFLTVQIFVPAGEGLSEAYALAKTVEDAFAGVETPSAVWFRNPRINEVGPDGEWYQVNFVVDFTYDEIK